MVASTWTLWVDAASKDKVVKWLADEHVDQSAIVNADDDSLELSFSGIDEAFRFRLQFDEDLLD
jgi:hypothetical protein